MADACPDCLAKRLVAAWDADVDAQRREQDELDFYSVGPQFSDWPMHDLPGSCGGCAGRGCGCGEGM